MMFETATNRVMTSATLQVITAVLLLVVVAVEVVTAVLCWAYIHLYSPIIQLHKTK